MQQALEVIEAARFSPMAGNIYTVRVILVQDEKKKAQISEAALQQYFIADASYVIVVCSEIEQLSRNYAHQAEKYARQQAGAAIENMLLKATDLGLASCWVGAFDEERVKAVLQVPEKVRVEAIIPLGNPTRKETQKRKPELKLITHFDKWGQREAKPERRPYAM